MYKGKFMEQFTFGVLAYNVEKYIIECLESIKYQIQNFGSEYECRLIVAEDCSTDNTLHLIEMWVNSNNGLFRGGVDIQRNNSNQGLVKNIISLYKNIKTNHFKVIDGDDIFYKNNIFELIGDNDVVVTQTIHFQENKIVNRSINHYFYKVLLHPEPALLLKQSYKYRHILDTPGVFFCAKFLNDSLYEAMGAYKMLDDIPRWKHIFSQEGNTIKVSDKPYILYRVGSGVSTNPLHEKRGSLDEDVKRLYNYNEQESFICHHYRLLKFSIFKKMVKYYYKNHSTVIKSFEDNFSNVLNSNEGNVYLRYIIEQRDKFLCKYKKEINNVELDCII